MALTGYITLVLAFGSTVYAITTFVFAIRREDPRLLDNARRGVLLVFVLLTVSAAVLILALFTHNFSIEYVANYSSTDTSPLYLFSALWAGNAGSMLFWAWSLSLFAAVVVLRPNARVKALVPHASVVLGAILLFFLVLLILVNNPFRQLASPPADGAGLNTQLETIGMVFHPPLLLAGFAICAVPFAFGLAALLTRRWDNGWPTAVRRWVLAGWLLLGVGNLIGAWWAYAELGWGGYWAWDPVENAGLMPWLIVTALLHSLNQQARRGTFRLWSVSLAMLAFTLTIFGTYLTRGDVLSSVHSFSEAAMGPFFIAFLSIIIAGSLVLLVYRRKDLRDGAPAEELVSAEGTFLLTNILFLGATFIILFGTIFPLISQALGGAKISLDQGFFNLAGLPFLLAVVFLAGVCTLIGWRRPSPPGLRLGLLWSTLPAVFIVVIMFLFGWTEWYALLPVLVCVFTFSAVVYKWQAEVRRNRLTTGQQDRRAHPIRCHWKHHAGKIVHLGIAIMTVGIIASSVYDSQAEAVLLPGESTTFGGYNITYLDSDFSSTSTRMAVTTNLSVSKNGKYIGQLYPGATAKASDERAVSQVAIRSTLFEDLYVMPVGWDPVTLADKSEVVQVSLILKLNPLVAWVWVGGAIVLVGGLISFWLSRRASSATGEDTGTKGRSSR